MSGSFRDLQVWVKAMALARSVYQATDNFPQRELFGLTKQVRRVAVSVPSNIAEGKGRSDRDFSRFLLQARGSLWEVETQLELARDLGFLDHHNCEVLIAQADEVSRMLNGMLSALKATPSSQ